MPGGAATPPDAPGRVDDRGTDLSGRSSLLDDLQATRAPGRVTAVLLGVALDVVVPYATDYLSAEDYAALSRMLEGPARRASDLALTTLAEDLMTALSDLDPALQARLAAARRWRV